MIQNIILALLFLAIILPIGLFFLGERKGSSLKTTLAINISSFFAILIFANIVIFASPVIAETAPEVMASTAAVSVGITDQGLKYIGAAFSTGLATIGAGIATGSAASAALGALSENGSIMGKALIFVGLAEGIAIYGLIISILILNQ